MCLHCGGDDEQLVTLLGRARTEVWEQAKALTSLKAEIQAMGDEAGCLEHDHAATLRRLVDTVAAADSEEDEEHMEASRAEATIASLTARLADLALKLGRVEGERDALADAMGACLEGLPPPWHTRCRAALKEAP